jgi:hypothetical protein
MHTATLPCLPRAFTRRSRRIHTSLRIHSIELDGAATVAAYCVHRRCLEASDEGSGERPSNRQQGVAYADLLPHDEPGNRNPRVGRAESIVVRAVVVNCHNNESPRSQRGSKNDGEGKLTQVSRRRRDTR